MSDLKMNVDSLDSFAAEHKAEGDQARVNAIEAATALLNMNTVFDVQNTKSAEFWRNFK